MKNKEIDQLNIKNDSARKELEKIKRLLNSPYFGKITIRFTDEEEDEDFYIGINGFKNEQEIDRIYDWRSPISELFYNNENGASHYEANQQRIEVDINGRRQFIIQKDQLINFFDTDISIQDDILLEALETDDSTYMKDITATIQQEQNKIIRATEAPVILVNGIAGSGKTSTVMQRIAYLLYLYRKDITAENVLLLSPNKHFVDYISMILPSLGEKNPINLTFLQFIAEETTAYKLENEAAYFNRISDLEVAPHIKCIRSKEFVAYMTTHSEDFLLDKTFFTAIAMKENRLFSQEMIYKIFLQTPKSAMMRDRIQATKKQLLDLWEKKLLAESRSQKIQDEILNLSETAQQKFFGRLLDETDENHLDKLAYQLLNRQYAKVKKMINQYTWIDQTKILTTLYTDFTQDVYPKITIKDLTVDEAVIFALIKYHFVERTTRSDVKFILVDEVQDYTFAQLTLLKIQFPKAAFTLVGDENQAIFNTEMHFEEIENLFKTEKRLVQRYDILNSYRSSGEITRLFARLAKNQQELNIIAVRADGELPDYFHYQNDKIYQAHISKIFSLIHDEPLIIITKSEAECSELTQKLQPLLQKHTDNLRILPISLAKGLEFDHVLVHNVSEKNYYTETDKRILYTAISRAMKTIHIAYHEELSKLLE